jgi:light-regulated signal transduction histidine kinase (bacteriophytochrome)
VNAQAEELKQANKELETFSYSVSHDLKAPLRSLEGFSKLLSEEYAGKLDEDGQRWLHFISENANKMSLLISDILAFSKVSRSTVNKSKVDMKLLAREVFDAEKNNYPEKPIHFQLQDIPDSEGDPNMLRLVWQNLISNALKYSSKKESIDITISGFREEEFSVYSVKDQGDGFDEKYKDKLFGVFQRLHNPDEFEGTGVGLAIANRIIQKHQGWITANSKKGNGSEFTFAIPLTKNQGI